MKMDSLAALCFPDTVPTFGNTAPLLLLLDKVVFYRPTESAPATPPVFAESDLVRSYAPTPLGKDLDLFLRLVKDLHTHAGEYANNFLSSLAPSMVSNFQEESVQQLITALTRGETQPTAPVKRDESFWQARLLLQLAEDIRADEMEMAQHLAKINAKQQQMLHSLREDDADEIPSLPAMPAVPPRLPVRDDLLCRAWCRLFLADHNEQRPAIAATANNEAAELLIDTYCQKNMEPVNLCDLPLPVLSGMSEDDFVGRRTSFRSTAATLFAEIDRTIQAAMTTGEAAIDTQKTREQWKNACSQHFGKEKNESSQLRITLLPGATMADLCRQLGKSDEQNAIPGAPHTVLMYLSPLF